MSIRWLVIDFHGIVQNDSSYKHTISENIFIDILEYKNL